MKTLILPRFKVLVGGSVAGAALLFAQLASATLVGPYTPDANTLFLVHFDEPAGSSVAANSGSIGGNFITTTNTSDYNGLSGNLPIVTTLLGYPSFSANGISFVNAVSGTNTDGLADAVIGFDGNGDGSYTSDNGSGISPDAIAMTNLNIGLGAGNSPFTIEALLQPSSITSGNQEILCSDSQSGSRGFQFRITSTGQLEFNFINQPNSDFTVPIPSSGPNAFVQGAWYHTALTYDGSTLRFYWTKMDPATTAANQIGSVAWTSTTADGAVVAPLIIGGENRGGEGEAFKGLIDEVRISSVARGPGDMQFNSQGVTIVQNPESQNIDNFMPVTFTVSAASTTPLGYQWEFNGTPIPDATNNSYSIASVQDTDAGSYTVVVTNTAGYSATSSGATLVVGAANFLAHRWSFTNDLSDSVGGATGTAIGDAMVSGGALMLDGTSNSYVSLPAHLLSGQTAVTFDFWATFGTNGDNCRVFDFGNTNFVSAYVPPPQNYVFFSPRTGAGNHDLAIAGGSSQSQQTLTGAGILDNQSVHVTCVVNPPDGYMSIYTNGVLEVTDTNLTVSLSSLNDELCWLGRSLFAADAWLNGSIDEFRIYDGALSATSVRQSDVLGPNSLIYDGPVKLITQPVNTTTAEGQPVTFSAGAVGHLPITYQWYENDSAILGATNTSYSFVAATGQNGDTFQLMATNTVEGTNYSVASDVVTLTLTVPEPVTWLGVNGANWDTTTLNWTNATSLVPFAQFDSAIFDDHGSSQPNVDLTEPIHLTGLTANSSANYVLASSGQNGSLSGHAPLIKQGSGKLTIAVPNQSTGGTLIQGGTLQIGNGGGAGTLTGGPVTNNAVLAFNRTNSITVTNVIHGSGSVQFDGTGSVGITGTNDYTGNTLINAGTVNLGNGSGLGATSAGTTVANGGTLYITANVDVGQEALTLNGSGPSGGTAGALRKGGAGLTTYYGPITLSGDTTLRVDGNATLNLTNSAGLNASSTANLTLTGDGGGQGIIVGPLNLGSSANLTVNGGATWTVGPNNNYSGLTTINGGALRITGLGSLGPAPGSFNASQITLNGGALEVAANVTLNDGKRGITVSSSSTITVDTNATFDIGNDITGEGSVTITKTGPGTLVLSGANDYLGNLNIDRGDFNGTSVDGMTVIANNAAIANMLALPGYPSIFIRNNNAATSTLGLDGSSGSIDIAQDISMAGRNNSVPAVDNLAGDNTISGGFTLATGGNYVLGSDSGNLTFSTAWPYAVPGITTARTVVFEGAGSITMSGGLVDGDNSGTNVPVIVVKNGTGTLNLPAANTYSGATTISNGVLSLTGSLTGTNGVWVAGGALAGTGTINDNVTVSNSAASSTIDALAVNGNFTISGPLVVDVNRSGLQSDMTSVSGTLANSGAGAIVVNNLGNALQAGDRFVLFNKAVANGAAMSVTGGGAQWQNNLATDGSITVSSVVPTTPTNITFSVSGQTLSLAWPDNYQGWILQVQTNALSVGLNTNWVDVPGSAAITSTNIALDPETPTAFYRLRAP